MIEGDFINVEVVLKVRSDQIGFRRLPPLELASVDRWKLDPTYSSAIIDLPLDTHMTIRNN